MYSLNLGSMIVLVIHRNSYIHRNCKVVQDREQRRALVTVE